MQVWEKGHTHTHRDVTILGTFPNLFTPVQIIEGGLQLKSGLWGYLENSVEKHYYKTWIAGSPVPYL